jgi:hypothetical protein
MQPPLSPTPPAPFVGRESPTSETNRSLSPTCVSASRNAMYQSYDGESAKSRLDTQAGFS